MLWNPSLSRPIEYWYFRGYNNAYIIWNLISNIQNSFWRNALTIYFFLYITGHNSNLKSIPSVQYFLLGPLLRVSGCLLHAAWRVFYFVTYHRASELFAQSAPSVSLYKAHLFIPQNQNIVSKYEEWKHLYLFRHLIVYKQYNQAGFMLLIHSLWCHQASFTSQQLARCLFWTEVVASSQHAIFHQHCVLQPYKS